MSIKGFSLTLGVIYLIIGVLGFFGIGVVESFSPYGLQVEAQHGRLFGLFPVNLLHNLFHLVIGIWGIAAASSVAGSRIFARSTAGVFGVLTLMGLLPGLAMTFGLMPLYGHNVWLHALTAGAAVYFGFASVTRREPAAT
jgi:hypothetical protein